MAAVSTMVISSLVALGEKSIGGTLSSDEGAHYLGKFNSFLESWSQERLMCFQITTDSFPTVANTSTYTIGANGTVVTARPNKVVGARVRDSGGFDHDIKVVSQDSYAGIGEKTSTAEWPTVVYYDAGFSATSTGTLHFWPVPSAVYTVFLDSWKQLSTVAHLSTNVLLPPGYQRAIESNFAIECSPGFIDPPAALVKIARESKAAIQSINLPESIMSLDAGVVRRHFGNVLDGP
jgi:hypothetical protein